MADWLRESSRQPKIMPESTKSTGTVMFVRIRNNDGSGKKERLRKPPINFARRAVGVDF